MGRHDAALLRAHLERFGEVGEVEVFATIGSTSDAARAALLAGAGHGAAFVADEQTAGRGRGDHRWHSPPAENVYLSVVLLPDTSARAMAALTLALGVAVAAVVDEHLLEPRARIKWPNDVYVDHKKIAGILVEATLQGNRAPTLVAGIGLNVLSERFPPELAERATSLALVGGHHLDRDRIAALLIARVRAASDAFAAQGLAPVLPALRRRDYLAHRRVRVGDVTGVVTGIDEGGRLLVDGQPVHAGEVTILG